MFGECHAHIFLNGRNYKEAVALHKNHVSEEAIRQAFAEYRKRGITFVRDGGDALHVSEYASKIAPQYGIDYRSPMFAIHRKGHYGRIVGCAWEDLEEYRDLVKKVKDLEKIFDSARANVSCAWEKGVLLAAGSDAGAYRVLHGQGLVDEYQIFCDLFGETEELKNRLKEGESVIRRKFQAEKVWKLTSKSTIIDAARRKI